MLRQTESAVSRNKWGLCRHLRLRTRQYGTDWRATEYSATNAWNLNLNEFDWMLEREFGFRYHGRYVDDFYIVSEDKKKILAAMPAIRAYLAGIGITLHLHKFFIQHYTKGVRFVGNIVKADRVYVLNRTVNGLRNAIER